MHTITIAGEREVGTVSLHFSTAEHLTIILLTIYNQFSGDNSGGKNCFGTSMNPTSEPQIHIFVYCLYSFEWVDLSL